MLLSFQIAWAVAQVRQVQFFHWTVGRITLQCSLVDLYSSKKWRCSFFDCSSVANKSRTMPLQVDWACNDNKTNLCIRTITLRKRLCTKAEAYSGRPNSVIDLISSCFANGASSSGTIRFLNSWSNNFRIDSCRFSTVNCLLAQQRVTTFSFSHRFSVLDSCHRPAVRHRWGTAFPAAKSAAFPNGSFVLWQPEHCNASFAIANRVISKLSLQKSIYAGTFNQIGFAWIGFFQVLIRLHRRRTNLK